MMGYLNSLTSGSPLNEGIDFGVSADATNFARPPACLAKNFSVDLAAGVV